MDEKDYKAVHQVQVTQAANNDLIKIQVIHLDGSDHSLVVSRYEAERIVHTVSDLLGITGG